MGTNYYWYEKFRCADCGCDHQYRESDRIHLGKASVGWKFMFQAYPDKEIVSLKSLIEYLNSHEGQIQDEYGDFCSVDYFIEMVRKMQKNEKLRVHSLEYKDANYNYLDSEGYDFSKREFS